jgi:hypothetical protein
MGHPDIRVGESVFFKKVDFFNHRLDSAGGIILPELKGGFDVFKFSGYIGPFIFAGKVDGVIQYRIAYI